MFGELIIGYLFLGGAGAGMAVVLSILDVLAGLYKASTDRLRFAWTKHLNRKFFLRAYTVCLLILLASVLCLLVDLGKPERFFYVFTYPTLSVLTMGSFFLGITILCAGFFVLVGARVFKNTSSWVIRVVQAVAVIFGFATMIYTGVLLAEMDFVSLWDNPALPALFTLSALSVGVALLVMCVFVYFHGAKRKEVFSGITSLDITVLVLELICVAVFVFFALPMGGETALLTTANLGLTSDYMLQFLIGFVVCGVFVPLVLDIVYARMKLEAMMAALIPFVILGGFYLRYWVVHAYVF